MSRKVVNIFCFLIALVVILKTLMFVKPHISSQIKSLKKSYMTYKTGTRHGKPSISLEKTSLKKPISYKGISYKVHRNDMKYTELATNFTILYWTPPCSTSATLGHDWFGMGEGSRAFDKCHYHNCILTSDRSQYNTSDAILVHMWILTKPGLEGVPSYRPSPRQKWIMFTGENPDMSLRTVSVRHIGYQVFNDVFNATWTYYRNSDIWTNYSSGYFVKKTPLENSVNKTTNYASGKTKFAAAFISNCFCHYRLKYIRKLQEYIGVDLFGKCGENKCPKEKEIECLEMIHKNYKFYLAFENNLCRDYVTEKLWKIIPKYNVIPIVMGGVDYANILPPKSYIDIGDFYTPLALAKHLKDLNSNDTNYNSYFAWKEDYEFRNITTKPACELCRYLNQNQNVNKIYDRLDIFWNISTLCSKPQTFYTSVHPHTWK